MVATITRMRKLTERLLEIRLGPGAVVLPQSIKRIHLRFPHNSRGAGRKFVMHELQRLKYHNPAVSMTVDRTPTTPESSPDASVLSIHYAPSGSSQSSNSATSSAATTDVSTTGKTNPSLAAPTERVDTIIMTRKTRSQIMEELIRLTDADPIELTPEDKEMIQEVEAQRLRSEADSKLMEQVKAQNRREQQLLEAAKGGLNA